MAKILLIESDGDLCELLRGALECEGYDLLVVHDGLEGLEQALAVRPDLIVLEVQAPGLDGYSVCRSVRRESAQPAILLTGREGEAGRILGLDLGADDYLTRPFSIRELIARVRALLRRGARLARRQQVEVLRCGSLHVDARDRRVYQGGREVVLMPREYQLLVLLMRNSGLVLTREGLLAQLCGGELKAGVRTVDVHICWLRNKLEADPSRPQYIQTVRGRGYRFAEGVQIETAERPLQTAGGAA